MLQSCVKGCDVLFPSRMSKIRLQSLIRLSQTQTHSVNHGGKENMVGVCIMQPEVSSVSSNLQSCHIVRRSSTKTNRYHPSCSKQITPTCDIAVTHSGYASFSKLSSKCGHEMPAFNRTVMLNTKQPISTCSWLSPHRQTSSLLSRGSHIESNNFQPTVKCIERNMFQGVSTRRYLSTSQNLSHPERQETIMNVFDRNAKRKQRDRAAMAEDVEVYDYIKDEMAYRMVDRVRDVTRKFPVALDLGCGRGLLAKYLTEDEVETLYQCEMSSKMLEQAPSIEGVKTIKLQVDEEKIPFQEESMDLVISNLSLHWVNDLPGTLRQIRNVLKKDGAFIGAMFGGDTLFELRCSLQLAEIEVEGGFAPHISPFTDMQDLGSLLTRAGFNMLTVDMEELTVNYPSMYELMHDLKGMAENNASWSRKNYLRRDTTAAAAKVYKDMYGNEDGSVPATFQVLFMIGWKPADTQAKPAARGSATASLKDLDKLNKEAPPEK